MTARCSGQIGRRDRLPGRQGPRTCAKYPWVADRPAGDAHAVHARPGQHVEAVLRGEEVAAAQHGPRAGVLLHLAEEVPRTRALRSAGGRCGRGRSPRPRRGRSEPSKMAKKRSPALRRVVHAAAELDGQRDLRRQGVADAGDDLQRQTPAGSADSRRGSGPGPSSRGRRSSGRSRRSRRRPVCTAAGANCSGSSPISCAPQGWSSSPTRRNRRAFGPLVTLTTNWSRSTSQRV